MLIEVWADLVCPWCYIGKQHLERALKTYQGPADPQVAWRAYRLVPGMKADPAMTLPRFMARRTGLPAEAVADRMGMVTRAASDAGLKLALEQAQPVDTFDAHRLACLAGTAGKRGEVTQRLMRAYTTEGSDLGDHATLARLGAECGIDTATALNALAGDDFAEDVRDDEERGREVGVSGVPFLLADGRLGHSGAQDAQTIHTLLDRAAQEQN